MKAISDSSVMVKQYKNSLKINNKKLLADVVRSLEVEIVEINKGQMLIGQTGLGNIRAPNTDLFDTGAFQGAMFMNVSTKYFIDSSDSKRDLLVDFQGKDIFDLNPEHLEMAQDLVTPKFNKEYHLALDK